MASSNYIKQQLNVLGWIVLGWGIYSLYIQLINQLYLGHFRNYINFTAVDIGFDYRKELVTTVMVSVIGSLAFGTIEIFILKQRFKSYPVGRKLLYKGGIYAVMIFILIWFGSLFYNTLHFEAYPWDWQVLNGVRDFTTSTGFVGNFMFIYMGILLTLVLLTIHEQLGPGRLADLLKGKYSKAIKEDRIFMFLDLKSSTAIAERLGHKRFFQLLNMFFADIAEPILEYGGKIYQYVGDEIVLTWKMGDHVENQRCLLVFEKMRSVVESGSARYEAKFGCVPTFKAGVHCGEVTTGEVGLIKKDIIHTGDVLNTTARIEKKCKELGQDLIISQYLALKISSDPRYQLIDLGEHELRGKERPMRLFGAGLAPYRSHQQQA